MVDVTDLPVDSLQRGLLCAYVLEIAASKAV
jgi:hypothetical protein